MTTIKNRIQAIQQQIHDCENQTGRKPDSVTLLAVSKAQPSALIREAFAAGQRKFWENYVQEALKKQTELHDLPIEWHFIGPIQSNKTQLIAQNFAWAHSIEPLKIAERLNDARPENLPPLQVCIQVNVSQEASKAGVSPEALADLAQAISLLPNIRLRGLMAIPEPTSDITKQHAQFKMLHDLLKTLTDQELALDTLSMGMSDDFPVAIAEGATTIRIGTAVFGQRKKPNNKIEKNYIMKTSFIGGGNMANALIGGLQKRLCDGRYQRH